MSTASEDPNTSSDPLARTRGQERPIQPSARADAMQRWRGELQIARNEREIGRLDRARERLALVVDEVEQVTPTADSGEARVGSEACLLLGDLEVRAINAAQTQAGAIDYLDGLIARHRAAQGHYERALRFGVDEMQQCTLLGMARASEWAAETSLRASQVVGHDLTEVSRRQQAWRSYLEESAHAYQRAQSSATSHPTCGPQAAEGFSRVQGRLTASR